MSTLPKAIICDIDGTIALLNERGPFDWNLVSQDLPNSSIIDLLRTYTETYIQNVKIILVTGRENQCRQATELWLTKHGVPHDKLAMRKDGDRRPDFELKREVYDDHIKGKYNVLFVLEDRNQVVKMWRELGLTCLQVAEGDF